MVWLEEAIAGEDRRFPRDANALRSNLQAIVRTLTRRYPSIRLIYVSSRIYGGYAVTALNPDIGAAAVTAVKGANSSAKVATFDLSPNIIKDIQSGSVEFAVDQQQYLQGYLPIVFLKLYKQNANTVGGGLPVLTGPGFVDKSNVSTVAKLAQAGTR